MERDEGKPGYSTDPTRFSDDDLLGRELSYGRSGFQLQFMLDIETNFDDGMFTKLITPYFTRIHPVEIEEVKHSKQKEALTTIATTFSFRFDFPAFGSAARTLALTAC